MQLGFPGGSDGKASACNAGDPGSIPGLGRSPGEGNGNPLQYSCLENSMDGRAWEAKVHGVAKSWTRLSDFTFTFRCYDTNEFIYRTQTGNRLQKQTRLPTGKHGGGVGINLEIGVNITHYYI